MSTAIRRQGLPSAYVRDRIVNLPSSGLFVVFASTCHSARSSSSDFGASTSSQLTNVPSSSVAVGICLEQRQESSTINFNLYCPGGKRNIVLKSWVLLSAGHE